MSDTGLTSLLYFLAFGALFYWMMKRGGCGMSSHGGHGGHGRPPGGGRDEHASPEAPSRGHEHPRHHGR
jgi:hypothetical protein